VVAGVYLIILIGSNMIVMCVMVLIIRLGMINNFDVKKNIAYSTSIHLLFILIISRREYYSGVVAYILLHRIVKRQIFQLSGYSIHGVRRQDIRSFSMNVVIVIGLVRIILLSAIIGIVIMRAKEVVILSTMNIMMILLIIISFMYTVSYVNKLNGTNYVGEMERYYVIVIVIRSMRLVMVGLSM
jgi:NADH:ubiquinone oxidoreductase subunit 5 (subunit L)/multisubunit Na+/H+ antiporter MnhA subunit